MDLRERLQEKHTALIQRRLIVIQEHYEASWKAQEFQKAEEDAERRILALTGAMAIIEETLKEPMVVMRPPDEKGEMHTAPDPGKE